MMKKGKSSLVWKSRNLGEPLPKLRFCAKQVLWDNIANRLYYAAFHAVSALLINDRHPVGTHQGAVIMLHQHYVKTGILPKEDGAFYSQLQTLREKSDYNCTYYATEQDTAPRIAMTEAFIEKVIGLIK